MEETGKAQPDPFGTTGAHKSTINHDGIIVLGRVKFQHHLASHRNTLAREHMAAPEGQIREYPFDNNTLAGIMDGANLGRILDRNSIIVSARIGFELAEEGGKAMGTELTAKGIDHQGAEEPISHPTAWSESRLRGPAFRATVGRHCR